MEKGETRNRCKQTEWRLMRTGSSDLIWKVEVREMRARRCREHGGLTGTVSVETWQENFHRSANVTKHSHWEPEEETDFKLQLTGQSESRYHYRYNTPHTRTAYTDNLRWIKTKINLVLLDFFFYKTQTKCGAWWSVLRSWLSQLINEEDLLYYVVLTF